MKTIHAAFLAAMLAFAGCMHLGPKSVAVDRFDYSTSIGDSWKQQTLLNIVKLRYMDLPVFVDVASIVAGYSMETSVSAGGSLPETTSLGGNTVTLGGAGRFTERPTITYVPMTGEKFLRGLITPIDPKNIFFMLQAGYPADFILGLTVESLNGVRNRSAAIASVRSADSNFVRALQLMREVQAAGAVSMRVEEDKFKAQAAVLFFQRDDLSPEIAEKSAEVRRLLHLDAGQQKFILTYSPARGADHELGVNSRSMLQIMSSFASYVDVPAEDLDRHIASPGLDARSTEGIHVRSGKDKPASAFTSVQYRDHWFWIDDGDLQTKRALTAVMFFFTLAETGSSDKLPLITIPAQ